LNGNDLRAASCAACPMLSIGPSNRRHSIKS